MKISALVVTKNRLEFVPWWIWNITKQTRQPDEIIVIDSSEDWVYGGTIDEVLSTLRRVYGHKYPLVVEHIPSRCVTGEARQRALRHAAGDFITWWDDDDYYHPKKLESYENALKDNTGCGAVQVMTHRLILNKMILIHSSQSFWYRHLPYSVFPANVACQVKFKPQLRGEDEEWLEPVVAEIEKRGGRVIGLNDWDLGGYAIIHGANTWQDESRFELEQKLSGQKVSHQRLFGSVDDNEWRQMVAELAALKERLGEKK